MVISLATGKAIAKKVKEAGRGTHVTLGVEGDEFTRTSRYKQEFCEKFSPEQQQAVKADVENKVRAGQELLCTSP